MTTYHGRSKGDEGENEGTTGKEIAQGTYEQHASGISGLHERCDGGGFFKRDVEVLGYLVEDGLVVVEV